MGAVETVMDLAKIIGWITVIIFFIAISITIIETSFYASKKRRDEEALRAEQSEMIRKALEEEIPKTIGDTVRQLLFDSIKKNKD